MMVLSSAFILVCFLVSYRLYKEIRLDEEHYDKEGTEYLSKVYVIIGVEVSLFPFSLTKFVFNLVHATLAPRHQA